MRLPWKQLRIVATGSNLTYAMSKHPKMFANTHGGPLCSRQHKCLTLPELSPVEYLNLIYIQESHSSKPPHTFIHGYSFNTLNLMMSVPSPIHIKINTLYDIKDKTLFLGLWKMKHHFL